MSHLVLINPSRRERVGVTPDVISRRGESLSLLSACQDIFGVTAYVIGENDRGLAPDQLADGVAWREIDGLSWWQDRRFAAELAASDVGVIFFGGAWLEEDVFVSALEGVRLGYDVRLLADLSIARLEVDRPLALDRLALHGVLTTTVRQTLLEWAICLNDADVERKVRQLLS